MVVESIESRPEVFDGFANEMFITFLLFLLPINKGNINQRSTIGSSHIETEILLRLRVYCPC
jgi:hypothetical protein